MSKQKRQGASRLVLAYALLAALWILLTDRLSTALADSPAWLTRIQSYRGLVLVAVTSLLLYWLLRRDAARRAEMERALREKQERLSESQQIAHIGSWSLDLATHELQWSEEMYPLFGVSPERFTLTPDTFLDLLHPDDRPAMASWIDDCTAGKQPGELVFRVMLPSGEVRVLNGRGRLYLDGGRPSRMAGTAQDITARMQTEEALHRWETIFQYSGWGVVLVEPDTNRLLMVNPAFAAMHGYTVEEMLGMPLANTLAPEERSKLPLYAQTAERAGHVTFEILRERKDGSHFPSLVDVGVIRDANGRVKYRAANLRDITERKQAESELRESARQLENLSRRLLRAQETERRRIARELHDEIGQLLTVIKLDLQAILRQCDVPTLTTALRESMDAIDQAIGRVRDLSLDLRPSLLDDLGLVPALRWLAQRQALRLDIAIDLDLPPGAQRLPGDIETACFRIVQEALTNAARHAAAHRIQVALALQDGSVTVEVCDDGKGFNPLTASDPAKESFGLLGMKERAELAGGTLEIRSAPEHGTTVTARFPLPHAAAMEADS